MATANLSVGINTKPAHEALKRLKDEMANIKAAIPVTIDPKTRVKIDTSGLALQIKTAIQDGFSGAKVSAGSLDTTQVLAALKKIDAVITTGLADAGQEGAKRLTRAITDDFGNLVNVSYRAGKASGKALANGLEEEAKKAKISYRFKEGAGAVGASLPTNYTAEQVKARAEAEALDRANLATQKEKNRLILQRIDLMRAEFEARKRNNAEDLKARAATNATRLDPRTLLGLPSRDEMKGIGASIAAQFREGAKVEALRASAASKVDARTLLGLPSRDEMKGIGASIAAQFREGAKVEALRASAASKVDARTLLGLPSRDEMKGIGASIAAQFREGAKVEVLRGASNRSRVDPATLLGIQTSGQSAKASASVFLASEEAMMGPSSAELVALKAKYDALQNNTKATKQLGEAHKEATGHTKTHAAAMRDAHSAARGLASGMGMMWLTWGNIAPLLAGASLSHGFIQAMKAGTEFAYQLTFVKALGGETAESVRGIGNAALELSKNGLFGPVELANGLRTLSQAGLSAAESMKALPVVLDLATVGEMNMKDAAVTLVGVMTAFNLDKSDLTKIGDVFAKAAAVSQTSVEQMTQAMKTASVVGEQYGATMQDTATALTLLAKMNITGTAAGTSLRNMLKELYSPTEKAAKIMKDLGVSAQTASGELKPFPDVIFSMKKKLEEFNKASQVKILQGLFGERGAKEAVAMLSLTREEWDKLNKTISESGGFMREVSAELEGTVKGSFKQAINTLQVSLIEAYNSTEGAAGQLAGKLKETFGSTQFKESLTTIVTGMLGITNALVTMAPALAVAAGGWIALRAAMIGAAVWTSVSTALAGATLATQTLGAVAAGTATTLTGSTGILAAARMLPGVMGAAGASLLATTGVLGPLAVAIGVAGTAWYLFRDRTVEAMQQSAAAVAQGAASMRTNLANILKDVHNLPAEASRKSLDAQRQVLVDNQNKLLEQRESLKKAYGIKSDAEAKEFSNKATSVHPVTGEVYTETGAKYDAVNAYLQAQATQKTLLKEFSKLNQTIESVAESEKKPEVTITPPNLKNWTGVGGGGGASREAGKLENAEIKNVLKDQAAIEKLYDTHYKRLIDLENASAQAGLITREQAEDKVTKLTEEQLNARMEINKNYHSALQEMLKTAKDLTPAQREQLTGEIERRGILLLELREELDYKKQIAEINRLGAEKRFNDNINKNNVELTKELEIAKAAVYGKITNPVDRARDNGETLVSNRYAQMIQEAVDARIRAEEMGDEASIKATAERLERLNQEVQTAKKYYGDQYAALAEYQQTGMYGWEKFWEKYQEESITAAKVVEGTLNSVTKNIEDAFSEMFTTGTLDFKKMTKAILADMGKLVAKMAVADLGNIITGKGKTSGTILGEIFGGKSAEGGEQSGLSGMLTKAADGLKGFWNSLTGATTATQDSTAKTVEEVLTMGTKKVAETSATAAMTELASAAQMAAAQLSTIGATGGGSGGGLLGAIGGLAGGGGSAASSIDTGALLADVFVDIMAKGGAYNNGVRAFAKGGTFTNRIVSQPTLFRFADGVGMMGEAGAEAIMPLGRDSQGRLGVRYEGREPPNRKVENKVTNNNVSVSINAPGGDPAKVRRSGAAVAREVVGAITLSGRYR